MRTKIALLFLLSILSFSSCLNPDKITFDGVKSAQVRGVTSSQVGVDMSLQMTNASGRNVTLSSANFLLKKADKTLMTIQLREPVQLQRKFSGEVIVPLSVRFEGLLGVLGIASTLSQGFEGCTIQGEVQLRSGMIKKQIALPPMSLDGVSKQLGFDPTQLLNLR